MARPDINRSGELEVFVRVIETGGFSAAARTLDMTPSAVSKLVARLEQRLGTRLLQRSTRQLQLTPEGCAFYERGLRVLADLEEAERCASAHAEPRGRLRVNSNVPFGQHFLLPLLPAFLERNPQVGVDLTLNDEVIDLLEQRTDVAVRAGPLKSSSLVARRLVEKGVPYVTINNTGWDTHKDHFQAMRRKLPELDKGLATLLQDLSDRGLLESTIIWCCGEFGRTPKVAMESPWNGGRHHYGKVFSVLVAGGGFKGGRVVGASDAKGETVKERPVYPCDLIGSMYELLGIDPDGRLPHPLGVATRMTPSAEEGVPMGGRLKEIM